jgi:hypothetical protein
MRTRPREWARSFFAAAHSLAGAMIEEMQPFGRWWRLPPWTANKNRAIPPT